jgi:hypothetical protein
MIQQISVTKNYPNQQITFNALGQNITLNLYFRGYIGLPPITQSFINTYAPPKFYADIYLNNTLIIAGTLVIDRTPINLYPSNLVGYIVSVDSNGNDDPDLENLGVTANLYFVTTLAEIADIVSLIP